MKSLKLNSLKTTFRGNLKVPNITRVELIDEKGRRYCWRESQPSKVEISIQDDGRTMKVFIENEKPCKFCGGQGSYYEDVAGDGGSRMEIPCDDCNASNPLSDENE